MIEEQRIEKISKAFDWAIIFNTVLIALDFSIITWLFTSAQTISIISNTNTTNTTNIINASYSIVADVSRYTLSSVVPFIVIFILWFFSLTSVIMKKELASFSWGLLSINIGFNLLLLLIFAISGLALGLHASFANSLYSVSIVSAASFALGLIIYWRVISFQYKNFLPYLPYFILSFIVICGIIIGIFLI